MHAVLDRRTAAWVPASPWTRDSTPARLLLVGVAVVLACLVTAGASVGGALGRTGAVDAAAGPVTALTDDAATIYGALADADADATSGFVSPGVEPPAVRADYDASIDRATTALVDATGRLTGVEDVHGRDAVTTLARGLPTYTGLIENARALNRLGLPLGQTYLVQASTLMRETLLPAAATLRADAGAVRAADLDRGRALPISVLVLGAVTLLAVIDLARGEARRTHRRRNRGLRAGAILLAVGLVWWVAVTVIAGVTLGHAGDRATAVDALDDARTAALQARSTESLVLVARSGGGDRTVEGLVDRAARDLTVADRTDHDPATLRAGDTLQYWAAAHRNVRRADDAGRYPDAVRSVVGATPDGSGTVFRGLDADLRTASSFARTDLASAESGADTAQTVLVLGPGLAFVLAGVAVGTGVWQRLREYR